MATLIRKNVKVTHAQLAAINLQYGLEEQSEDSKLLVIPTAPDHDGRIMAATSPSYGRIWDYEVVDAVPVSLELASQPESQGRIILDQQQAHADPPCESA